ncbi:MAG: hypothetical protein MUP58_03475 [Candidatus Nanohaloarchaeota archaeon QJJ-9]|nr:hypothetical protein [Candidatus Nanohaloarchaeota archaeon QJJ-9]
MRKGLSFGYVLIVAIGIFIIGGLLAGGGDLGVNLGGEGDGKVVFSQDIGAVGDVNHTSKSFNIGEVEVKERPPNRSVKNFSSLEVTRGILGEGSSEALTFEANNPNALYVSFTVEDAVRSGKLKFRLNGNVEKEFEPKPGTYHSIKLTNLSKGTNTLQVAAGSPSLKFWKKTSYNLKDVEIVLSDEFVSRNTRTFRLFDYQVKGFDEATLRADIGEAKLNKPLKIDINGNEVYSNSIRDKSIKIPFTKADTGLHPGENTVSFLTETGAFYNLNSVVLDVKFYSGTEQRSVKKEFEVSGADYQLFRGKNGTIGFDVSYVGVPRADMTIKLNNRTYSFKPESGENRLNFTREDLRSGTNTLTLTSPGSYRINDFEVKLGED